MFKALMNGLLNLLGTVVQIICLPINSLISNLLPDLSSKINEITSLFSSIFDSIVWALGIIPQPVLTALSFIITIEIVKHSIFVGTHLVLKVWGVLQKIKFW